jgi:hypothetical protein
MIEQDAKFVVGDFIRGELGQPGCDDDTHFIQVAERIKALMNEAIRDVKDNA